LYEEYGANGDSFSTGVHQHVHTEPFGTYSFTGLDLAPNPGPGRPFNFFAVPTMVF